MAVLPVAQPHRFTVDEYHRMAETGILGPDERIELLQGEIVEMAPIGSRHAACVMRLDRLFQQHLGADRALVLVQGPVRLSDRSEPQPDAALLRPRGDDYAGAHSTADDLFLVVEVGDPTAALDAQQKLPIYARAGVRELWLVDLMAGAVKVCRVPEDGAYRQRASFGPGQHIAPVAFPDVEFDVESILPPAPWPTPPT